MTLFAYPFMLSVILLPTLAFDVAAASGHNSVTGNKDAFLILAVVVATVAVWTWLSKTFTRGHIAAGAFMIIGLVVFVVMNLGLLMSAFGDSIFGLHAGVYWTWTVAAASALSIKKLPWATATSLLSAPFLCALWVRASAPFMELDISGYLAGAAALVVAPLICILFDPLLSRYQMHPK